MYPSYTIIEVPKECRKEKWTIKLLTRGDEVNKNREFLCNYVTPTPLYPTESTPYLLYNEIQFSEIYAF